MSSWCKTKYYFGGDSECVLVDWIGTWISTILNYFCMSLHVLFLVMTKPIDRGISNIKHYAISTSEHQLKKFCRGLIYPD